MTSILRALYFSTPTFKVSEDTIGDQIVPILNTACAENPKIGVTGCLAFTKNYFIQVLEGPPAALSKLMGRIEKDGRHDRMAIFFAQQVDERLFSEWSMAFAPPETLDKYRYARRSMTGDLEPQHMEPPDLIQMMYDIVASKEFVLNKPVS